MADIVDMLSAEGIKEHLSEQNRWLDISVIESVDSTINVLRKRAKENAPEGETVIALSQTAGRGRRGHSFHSAPDTGIYLSLLLRPKISADRAVLITCLAGVAVCEAVERLSEKRPKIKWVNDVLIDGKKICGILTESSLITGGEQLEYAVLGIGINVYPPDGGFPEEIKDVADSVFNEKAEGMKNRLTAEFLNAFMSGYRELLSGGAIEKYKTYSLVIGKRINVVSGEKLVPATALDIDDGCRLLVRYDDGSEATLSSGDISVKL